MREKFKYNSDTLRYVKVKHTFPRKIMKFLVYLVAITTTSIALLLVFSNFYDTPKEKRLKRERDQLITNYRHFNTELSTMEKVLQELEEKDDNIYRTIFEAEPIPKTIREAGMGGVNRYEYYEGQENSDLIIYTAKKLDKIKKKMYIQSKSYDKVINLAKNKEKMISCIPAIMPISNRDLTRTSSGWGWRYHPIYKIRRFHYGMDFTAPIKTEVYATGDGVIKSISYSRRGYGNKIEIDHDFGYVTLYAHLYGFNVKKGQKVKRGDVIGFVGNSGLSTGPHLHYEVHKNGKRINPVNYYFNDLSPSEYNRIIEISAKSGQSFD